jgi:hypothetical protein
MPERSISRISFDEIGLSVTALDPKRATQAATLLWNDVHTVVAYKRAAYAYDLICVTLGNDKAAIEVNEQMQGWSELVEGLPAFLPGTPPLSVWWEQVAKPPFATSRTTLFTRT